MSSKDCLTLREAVALLKGHGVNFALVHEAALAGWDIDYNVFLDNVDVLLIGEEDFAQLGVSVPNQLGQFALREQEGVNMRIWSRTSLGLPSPFEVTACEAYGCEALAPELVLAKLPYSPDARLLAEQRAQLAAILNADALTDEELHLYAKYVRGA